MPIPETQIVIAGFSLRWLKPATTMFDAYEPNEIGRYLLKKKRHYLILNIKQDSSHSFGMRNDAVISGGGLH